MGVFADLARSGFGFFGLDVRKKKNVPPQGAGFDAILRKYLPDNPVIFDVGANQGQSIDRFKKDFRNPVIHSFEPIKHECDKLKAIYANDPDVFLNNCAVGESDGEKEFHIAEKTGSSSFNKLKKDSEWIRQRSKQVNTTPEKYVKSVEVVKVVTLDKYCADKNIQKIDLLRIDTQGYEDMVLKGGLGFLAAGKVDAVLTEIMFDDVYEKYFNFSDIEKCLVPNDFRMVGIDLVNNSLFSGIVFWADVLYFRKKRFGI